MSMTPDLLAHLTDDERALLRLAEAATPGLWETEACDVGVIRGHVVSEADGATSYELVANYIGSANAAFIAAANPAATIAHLTALAKERRERTVLQEAFADCVLEQAVVQGQDSAWMLQEMVRREQEARHVLGIPEKERDGDG